MKKTHFQPTTADKFKNVWLEKRCLRCFSSLHRARQCKLFTKPTPTPCRFCWYLYHDTAACVYFDQNGKRRPASINRVEWQFLPTDEIFVPPSWVTADVNYYTEQWIDENDFTFLNDTLYEISKKTSLPLWWFKFPENNPSLNLIVEDRTPAQIVSDILRIWCQFLTKNEKKYGMTLPRGTSPKHLPYLPVSVSPRPSLTKTSKISVIYKLLKRMFC